MCSGIRNDFDFLDFDVIVVVVFFLFVIFLWCFGKFIIESSKEILNCIVYDNLNLCYVIVEMFGCLFVCDDVVNFCVMSFVLLDIVLGWWW